MMKYGLLLTALLSSSAIYANTPVQTAATDVQDQRQQFQQNRDDRQQQRQDNRDERQQTRQQRRAR